MLQECFIVVDELLRLDNTRLTAVVATAYVHCPHLDDSAYGNQLARQLMPRGLSEIYIRQHFGMLP